MKKKYRVWFEQINKVVYDVAVVCDDESEAPLKALEKARAEWRADHCVPNWYMEDENGEEVQ